MNHSASLLLFTALVFGIIVLPGLDMAYVMGSSLVAGRRHGMAAVAGVIAGGVGHVVLILLGIGMLLKVIPGAFNALLLAGAIYIAWIGISLLRTSSGFGFHHGNAIAGSEWATVRRGALTCLMNPKAYLFMLAVFPQFLRAEYGPLWMQALELWLIIAATQLVVYGAVAMAAAQTRGWLARKPAAGIVASRAMGGVLVAAAGFTAFEGWRA